MSHPWATDYPESELRFLPAQQLSRRLAAIVENSNASSSMDPTIPGEEEEVRIGLARPSSAVSVPPRSSSMPVSAQQAPLQPAETTIREYPPAGSTVIGRTESLFGAFWPSTSMSAPSRPSSNPTTIEYPPAGPNVRYPASERPASTTASLHRPSSNSTPTLSTTLASRPETQSQTNRVEEAFCLSCAKEIDRDGHRCPPYPSDRESRCLRCVARRTICKPIPAEHLPGFRAIQQLFREGKIDAAFAARDAWIESIKTATPSDRIERQLFLLNRNVERLLNWHLRMYGERPARLIEEEFPED